MREGETLSRQGFGIDVHALPVWDYVLRTVKSACRPAEPKVPILPGVLGLAMSGIERRTFDIVDQLQAASDCDEVYSLLGVALSEFGFTNFLITEMPPPGSGLQASLILNGWSKTWFDRYMDQNFFLHDPMAAHTRSSTQAFFWDEVRCPHPSKEARRVMNEAAECGLRRGFSVPILGSTGEQSCVTMGGAKLDIPHRGREALQLLSIFAHGKAQSLRPPPAPAAAGRYEALTEREREVLLWVARGKTDWEIGEILAISEQTAKAHLRNSLRKLNAVSRAHAVANAISWRAISL